MLIEKTTELGATHLVPVHFQHTQKQNKSPQKWILYAQQATEQCGRLNVPKISPAVSFKKLITTWDSKEKLYYCDEIEHHTSLKYVLETNKHCSNFSLNFLVGPEGGLHPQERALLQQHPFAMPITLGAAILRSETAAISCIALASLYRKEHQHG